MLIPFLVEWMYVSLCACWLHSAAVTRADGAVITADRADPSSPNPFQSPTGHLHSRWSKKTSKMSSPINPVIPSLIVRFESEKRERPMVSGMILPTIRVFLWVCQHVQACKQLHSHWFSLTRPDWLNVPSNEFFHQGENLHSDTHAGQEVSRNVHGCA